MNRCAPQRLATMAFGFLLAIPQIARHILILGALALILQGCATTGSPGSRPANVSGYLDTSITHRF